MSIAVMTRVWESSALGGTELLLLLAIADHANDQGTAWPSIGALARKIRMSERSTHYLLARIAKTGELSIERNKGPRGCNLFRVQCLQGADIAGVQESVSRGCKKQSPRGATAIAPESSVNRQGTVRSTPRTRKTAIPDDFQISERVKAWAEKKGFDQLDDHLETFKSKCAANGYTYVDHDAAFMGAIREDWAKLRRSTPVGRRPPAPEDFASISYGKGGKL